MATSPRSRPGRYAELETGQLADTVELAFERGDPLDWELVFELTRRAMSAAADDVGDVRMTTSRPA